MARPAGWRTFTEDLKFATMLLRRDVMSRYAGNLSGAVNAYVVPFLTVMIYAIIFSFIFEGRLPGQHPDVPYVVYLCSGLVLWLVVAEVLPRASGLFLEFSQILRQRGQRKSVLFLFLFLITIQLFVFYFASMGILMLPGVLEFNPAGFLTAALLSTISALYLVSIGILFAYGSVFVPDLRTFLPVLLQVGFWGSPIAYTSHIIPTQWQSFYQILMTFNPFFALLRIYQELMTTGVWPDPEVCLQALGWFLVMTIAAALVSLRFSDEIPDLV